MHSKYAPRSADDTVSYVFDFNSDDDDSVVSAPPVMASPSFMYETNPLRSNKYSRHLPTKYQHSTPPQPIDAQTDAAAGRVTPITPPIVNMNNNRTKNASHRAFIAHRQPTEKGQHTLSPPSHRSPTRSPQRDISVTCPSFNPVSTIPMIPTPNDGIRFPAAATVPIASLAHPSLDMNSSSLNDINIDYELFTILNTAPVPENLGPEFQAITDYFQRQQTNQDWQMRYLQQQQQLSANNNLIDLGFSPPPSATFSTASQNMRGQAASHLSQTINPSILTDQIIEHLLSLQQQPTSHNAQHQPQQRQTQNQPQQHQAQPQHQPQFDTQPLSSTNQPSFNLSTTAPTQPHAMTTTPTTENNDISTIGGAQTSDNISSTLVQTLQTISQQQALLLQLIHQQQDRMTASPMNVEMSTSPQQQEGQPQANTALLNASYRSNGSNPPPNDNNYHNINNFDQASIVPDHSSQISLNQQSSLLPSAHSQSVAPSTIVDHSKFISTFDQPSTSSDFIVHHIDPIPRSNPVHIRHKQPHQQILPKPSNEATLMMTQTRMSKLTSPTLEIPPNTVIRHPIHNVTPTLNAVQQRHDQSSIHTGPSDDNLSIIGGESSSHSVLLRYTPPHVHEYDWKTAHPSTNQLSQSQLPQFQSSQPQSQPQPQSQLPQSQMPQTQSLQSEPQPQSQPQLQSQSHQISQPAKALAQNDVTTQNIQNLIDQGQIFIIPASSPQISPPSQRLPRDQPPITPTPQQSAPVQPQELFVADQNPQPPQSTSSRLEVPIQLASQSLAPVPSTPSYPTRTRHQPQPQQPPPQQEPLQQPQSHQSPLTTTTTTQRITEFSSYPELDKIQTPPRNKQKKPASHQPPQTSPRSQVQHPSNPLSQQAPQTPPSLPPSIPPRQKPVRSPVDHLEELSPALALLTASPNGESTENVQDWILQHVIELSRQREGSTPQLGDSSNLGHSSTTTHKEPLDLFPDDFASRIAAMLESSGNDVSSVAAEDIQTSSDDDNKEDHNGPEGQYAQQSSLIYPQDDAIPDHVSRSKNQNKRIITNISTNSGDQTPPLVPAKKPSALLSYTPRTHQQLHRLQHHLNSIDNISASLDDDIAASLTTTFSPISFASSTSDGETMSLAEQRAAIARIRAQHLLQTQQNSTSQSTQQAAAAQLDTDNQIQDETDSNHSSRSTSPTLLPTLPLPSLYTDNDIDLSYAVLKPQDTTLNTNNFPTKSSTTVPPTVTTSISSIQPNLPPRPKRASRLLQQDPNKGVVSPTPYSSHRAEEPTIGSHDIEQISVVPSTTNSSSNLPSGGGAQQQPSTPISTTGRSSHSVSHPTWDSYPIQVRDRLEQYINFARRHNVIAQQHQLEQYVVNTSQFVEDIALTMSPPPISSKSGRSGQLHPKSKNKAHQHHHDIINPETIINTQEDMFNTQSPDLMLKLVQTAYDNLTDLHLELLSSLRKNIV